MAGDPPTRAERMLMAGTPMLTSVVISTRNRPVLLGRCLASIRTLRNPSYEVIVVESVSTVSESVAKRFGARYVAEPLPGLSRARNVGARHARGDIVAFLDDDTTVDADWLGALVREFEDPAVMAVAGQVLPHLGGTDVWSFRRPDRRVVERNHEDWFEVTNFGGIGNGSNLAIRRSAFTVWPGFDERLGMGRRLAGAEENHAFFKLVQLGYRVVSTPDAVVFHDASGSALSSAERTLQATRHGAAYLLLLLLEERGHRMRALRYGLEAVFSKRRSWRPAAERAPGPGRLARLLAVVQAVGIAIRTAIGRG